MKESLKLAVILMFLLIFQGCGSSSSKNVGVAEDSRAVGSVSFTINWPQVDKQVNNILKRSKTIPTSVKSIKIYIEKKGKFTITKTINRENNETEVKVNIYDIPAHQEVKFKAEAYDGTNASGNLLVYKYTYEDVKAYQTVDVDINFEFSMNLTKNPTTDILANDEDTAEITAEVKYKIYKETEVPVGRGVDVTFTIESGTATFAGGGTTYSATTDSEGKAKARVKSGTVGTVTIKAKSSEDTTDGVYNTIEVKFCLYELTFTPGSSVVQLAGSQGQKELIARVAKTNGDSLTADERENLEITFSKTSGTGELSGTNPAHPNAGGEARITVTSSTEGTVSVRATLRKTAINEEITYKDAFVQFTNNKQISLSSSPSTVYIVSGGSGTSTITATVTNSEGQAVEGETVNFSITSGTGSLSAGSAATNAQGKAEVTLSSSFGATQTVVVKGTISGTEIWGSTSVLFTTNYQTASYRFLWGRCMLGASAYWGGTDAAVIWAPVSGASSYNVQILPAGSWTNGTHGNLPGHYYQDPGWAVPGSWSDNVGANELGLLIQAGGAASRSTASEIDVIIEWYRNSYDSQFGTYSGKVYANP